MKGLQQVNLRVEKLGKPGIGKGIWHRPQNPAMHAKVAALFFCCQVLFWMCVLPGQALQYKCEAVPSPHTGTSTRYAMQFIICHPSVKPMSITGWPLPRHITRITAWLCMAIIPIHTFPICTSGNSSGLLPLCCGVGMINSLVLLPSSWNNEI